MRARHLLGAATAATVAAALWWRKNPSACPYGQRFWVEAPHPFITRDRLKEVLRPKPGERLLELGVGTGYYSCELAEWIAPEGTLELFDLQQKFLDHTLQAATDRGLTNLVPTQGDATQLPYDNASSTP
jgi:ubiquinone/menaquinone biosynthesis C-methylase UbiE